MDTMADGGSKATPAADASESGLDGNPLTSKGVQVSTFGTVTVLGQQLLAQEAAFKTLLNKAGLLECVVDRRRSEQVKSAIQELLSVLQVFRDSREQFTRSYNVVFDIVRKEEAVKSVFPVNQVAESPEIERRDMETQSPCW